MANNADTRTKPVSIADQSAAIVASAAKGAAAAKTNLANAKSDQASVIAGNTALAGLTGGTVNPTTGHITPKAIPTSTGGGAAATTTPTDLSGGTADDIFINGLSAMGLGSLANSVQGLVNQGIGTAGIISYIRSTPDYTARFPAMAAMNAKGMGISEAQYIAKEDTDRQLLYQYLGPSAATYDNYAQLGSLMLNNVNSATLQTRLQGIHDIVNASADTKNWLQNTYGLSQQDLAAAWLDPSTTSDPVTLRAQAAQIGGAGFQSGFGTLTQAQAEALVQQGVSLSQAQSTFAKIGNAGQLEQDLPGNDPGSLTQQQILDGAFDGGAPGQALTNLQDQRVGEFQANGGVAADTSGVGGNRSAAV